jgi:hypothetical protein
MPLSRAERERGVSIARVNFGVQKGNVVMQWTPQACVSLHALARRIERGSTRDHSALALDLAKLVQTDEKSERVDTIDGFWLGEVCPATNEFDGNGCRLRDVRTWLSSFLPLYGTVRVAMARSSAGLPRLPDMASRT